MSNWRLHARAATKPMVQVPLAATYMAARLLQEEKEEGLLAALLKHLHDTLASCPSRENSALAVVEYARRAAIPLDRDDLDCLFAAGALADGSLKNRAFRCTQPLLGLGYLDLDRSRYVATLADFERAENSPQESFLPSGGFEKLRHCLPQAQQAACGLVVHENSPTLFALDLGAGWLKEVRQSLEQALATADGIKVECRLYVRGGVLREEKNFKFHSATQLALQPLDAGNFALAQATPEWLMGLHACSMQEAWLHLACPWFRMVCRLPDISAPSQLVPAAGFSPHDWFLQYLGIPDNCCAYLPEKLMEPLTQRYSWFAATDPLIWLVNTGALVQPLADC